MLELTNEVNFETIVLNGTLPVLVDFFAEWCAPCKMLYPILEEISRELDGKLHVMKINIDTNAKLAEQYGIRSIPTMMLFVDGKVVDTMVGGMSKDVILDRLNNFM